MKAVPGFDCLKLKDEIQAKLLEEWRGLSDEQVRERIQRELESSSEPIAKSWRRQRTPRTATEVRGD